MKIDLAALDRGHTLSGEVSEIAGQGPIPVADVWRMIDGGAFVAAVSTRGTEISKVVHLGRRPTELQRTALEFLSDGACQIDGCTSKARLEIDHVADWAATRRTELDELARVCGHHHDLKTHQGHTFGPLTANGRRRLIPPIEHGAPPGWTGDIGPPGSTGPPDLTVLDDPTATTGGESAEARPPTPGDPGDAPGRTRERSSLEERARAIGRRGQGNLFDTG